MFDVCVSIYPSLSSLFTGTSIQYPATASFLTEAERKYVIDLMQRDSQGLATHYNFQFVVQALTDYKIYLQFILYIGYVDDQTSYSHVAFLTSALASLIIPGYGIALFTPTIINDLGFSAADAQLLSVPPFVAGCIITVVTGIYSDKRQLRGPFVIFGTIVAIMGYIVLYTQTSPGISYFGTVLVAMGIFPCIPVDLAWISSNAGGDIKRGAAIAMVNGFGNIGGCVTLVRVRY